ncbi:(2Fe-2S)-binding protein [Gordonia sp. TBRC 11910]|uniref:(2Fe-2S)-binding protein n=1 Tax=Gordonia asplenii TaxID=2725283 RepID=A0A848KSC6_9ACTN|nr:(2Fe-2S)-binding protein [Gordonia asplenii]NMO01029.1 (2Fe-2S)-binding protein [Gordonia asplenii]
MFVCICRGVTEEEVNSYLDDGADSVDAIGDRCGAGEGCGTCLDRLDEMVCARAGICGLRRAVKAA